MLCAPTARLLVLQVTVRVLPVPTSAAGAQIALPPSVKLTLPVGLVPVTVAVKVTLLPTVAGVGALPSVVVVGGGLMTCESGALFDDVLLVSPV